MPDRTYTPRQPPSIWDRMLHHPWETTLATWWAICGAVLVLGIIWPQAPTSPSLDALPRLLILTVAVLVGIGGTTVLVGLLYPFDRLDHAWMTERVGLVATAVGWATYATAVTLAAPHSLVSWSLGWVMAAGAVLRLVASLMIESATRHAVAVRAVLVEGE